MIDFLAGVPGKLSTLLNRLTATWSAKLDTLHDSRLTAARAGYLDKLNVAGKATDDAVWTPTKAGYLDMAISGVCRIRSIQHVDSFIVDGNVDRVFTITAVTVAKSIIISRGYVASSNLDYTQPEGVGHIVQFVSSTGVRAARGGTTSGNAEVSFTVIEFY